MYHGFCSAEAGVEPISASRIMPPAMPEMMEMSMNPTASKRMRLATRPPISALRNTPMRSITAKEKPTAVSTLSKYMRAIVGGC